jgi:hypothetical protein
MNYVRHYKPQPAMARYWLNEFPFWYRRKWLVEPDNNSRFHFDLAAQLIGVFAYGKDLVFLWLTMMLRKMVPDEQKVAV